jgi:stress response protein SCP2
MNWKLPGQGRWIAQLLRDDGSPDLAEIVDELVEENNYWRSRFVGEFQPPAIEEGDRANG